jgi:hypothetical protein
MVHAVEACAAENSPSSSWRLPILAARRGCCHSRTRAAVLHSDPGRRRCLRSAGGYLRAAVGPSRATPWDLTGGPGLAIC